MLLPGYFACVGLAILKLTTTIKNPNLVLSTNQGYGSESGAAGYEMPYTNVTGYDANRQFGLNSSLVETFDALLAPRVGELDYVALSNATLFDVRPFQEHLLDHTQSDAGKWHYNSLWTSYGYFVADNGSLPDLNLTLPPEFNVTLPPFNSSVGRRVTLNNTIQLGINCTVELHAHTQM